MHSSDETIPRSAAVAHESSDASADLSKLSEQMQSQLSQFQLPAERTISERTPLRQARLNWSLSPSVGD